jgi:hypothetical protein
MQSNFGLQALNESTFNLDDKCDAELKTRHHGSGQRLTNKLGS